MEKLKLPELKKVNKPNPRNSNKPTILLLSDDLRLSSGIAVMSREIVLGSLDKYNWVQLAASIKHPDEGKIIDMSLDAQKISGVKDANLTLYPSSGYGTAEKLRTLINRENPTAIIHFTDPRYWQWLYTIEHEIRQMIPLIYYNIWDDSPTPNWNLPYYESCDLIMNISKQTHALVQGVLQDKCVNLDNIPEDVDISYEPKTYITYVPHGINSNTYKPVKDKKLVASAKEKFWNDTKSNFIIMINNRNIRRKNLADVILAYKTFCDMLPEKEAQKCLLAMNTQPVEEAGTDLVSVKNAICPNYKIVFSGNVSESELNLLYNGADVVVNVASNEGYGLTTAEALMAGTPMIINVTGGLQDQLRFEDENGEWITQTPDFPTNHNGRYKKHGNWGIGIFPKTRSLKGSPQTPYIFDDTADWEDLANAIYDMYKFTPETRQKMGVLGREWMLSEESGMSAKHMAEAVKMNIEFLLNIWKPKKNFNLYPAKFDNKYILARGILKSEI